MNTHFDLSINEINNLIYKQNKKPEFCKSSGIGLGNCFVCGGSLGSEEFRVIYVPTFRLGDGNNTVKWNQLSIMGTLYLMDSIILQTIQRYII